MLNGNFEVDSDGSAIPDYFAWSDGQQGLSLDKTSGSPHGQAVKLTVSSGYSVYLSDLIQVNTAKSYSLSGKVKGAQASGTLATILSLLAYDANGVRIGTQEYGRIVTSGTFDWKTVNSTLPTPEQLALPTGTKSVRVKLAVSNSTGAGASWFDAVQLEEGTISTDFAAGDLYTAHAPTRQSARYDGDGNKELYTFGTEHNLEKYQQDPLDLNMMDIYSWSNNDLSSHTDGEGRVSSYQYDGNGNLTVETNPLKQKTSYAYDNQSNLKTTSGLRPGEQQLYTYDADRHEKTSRDPYYTSWAKSHDSFGNVTNETTPLGWADNLIDNSGFEGATTVNGMPSRFSLYDAATGSWSVSNDAAYGSKALKLTVPQIDTKKYSVLVSDSVSVKPTETYVLAGFLKAEQTSGVQTTVLSLYAYDSAGILLGEVGLMNPQGQMDSWQRWSTAIQPSDFPTGTATVRVKMATKNEAGTGSSSFDAIQFQKNPVDTAYNLVDNSSFERGTLGVENWARWGSTGTLNWLSTPIYAGGRSVSVENATGDAGFVYSDYIPYDKNQTYTLTAFLKGEQLSANVANLRIERYDVNKLKLGEAKSTPIGGDFDWKRLWVELQKNDSDTQTAYIRPVLASGSAGGRVIFDNARLQAGRVMTANTYSDVTNYTRLEASKDPLGNMTSYRYDKLGNADLITSPRGYSTEYKYDSLSNLLDMVILPGNDLKIDRDYDQDGYLKTIKYVNPNTGVILSDTAFVYNKQGQVESSEDPLRRKRQYTYTPAGRLQKTDFQIATREVAGSPDREPIYQTISYSYGKTGLLNNVYYDSQRRYSFGYYDTGSFKSATDEIRHITWSAQYDPLNRLSEWFDGKGKIAYSFNDLQGSETRTITLGTDVRKQTLEYDLADQPTKLVDESGISRFLYDEKGNPSFIQVGNGVIDRRMYDSVGRVTHVQTQNELGETLSSYSYEYDQEGNVIAIHTGTGSEQKQSFEYNEKGQLIKERLPNGNIVQYKYDDVLKNRSLRTEFLPDEQTKFSETTFVYDKANQLTSVNGVGWQYNDRGYLTSNGAYKYHWDAGGRLAEVTKDSDASFKVTYQYDHLGRRVQQNVNGKLTNFLYDGLSNRVAAEYDLSGVLLKTYTWGPEEQLLSIGLNGVTYYAVHNGHGDVVQLTDAEGKIVAWYQYDAWGTITGHSEGNTWMLNPYRYSGYRYDEETGLYYLMARYYDPKVGRFLSPDPLFDSAEYKYAEDTPLRYKDPTGLAARDSGNHYGGGSQTLTAGASVNMSAPARSTTRFVTEQAELAADKMYLRQLNATAKKSRSKPRECGIPSTCYTQRDPDGAIGKYTEYDSSGRFVKEVRITGKDHGGIPRPNVKYRQYHENPKTGETFYGKYKVRKAEPDEIPEVAK